MLSTIKLSLLKKYPALKHVVLKTCDNQRDYNLLIENIKKECPNVQVHIVDLNGMPNKQEEREELFNES